MIAAPLIANLSDAELRAELARRDGAKPRRLPLAREVTTAPPRSECVDEPRPCERACRYRLDAGACALDLAELGGMTLGEIAPHFNLTRERIRQIEATALENLAKRLGRSERFPATKGTRR